jgi:ribosomal protein L29
MSEESYETTDEYKEETAKLFELMQRRDEMRGLLKIAQPSKIAEVRKTIATLDNLIKETEEIMEIIARKHRMEIELDKRYEELDKTVDAVLPELLAYLAEHNPEAYEKLKASLEEIDAREDLEDE